MKNFPSIVILLYLILCLFYISNHFANPTTSTFYIAICGCCILTILHILQNYKQPVLSLSLSEVLLGGLLLYAIVNGAIGGSLNPEWIISVISLGLLYLVLKRIYLNNEWIYMGLVIIGIAQAIYGLGQYVHWFSNIAAPSFTMSGSFDNPAGFAASLAVCSPFTLFLLQNKGLYPKIIGGISLGLITLAVFLSQSRAGIITIIVVSVIWAVKSFNLKWIINWRKHTKIIAIALMLIVILAGLYLIKKDSANGRLLIWQCTAHMIVDNPLFGHGIGGFQREYMLYQAEYFRNIPNSSFSMLADIVKHPFNEYLLFLVEHGIVGGLFLSFFVIYIFRGYCKNMNHEKFYALLCLIAIAVFACFSYPLGYPFIRIMAVFCLALIMQDETKRWQTSKKVFLFIKPIALTVSFVLLIINCKMFYDEYRWNTIAQRSLAGETKNVLPDYAQLYKTMNHNGLFLYNYAAELNYLGNWKKSNKIMMECSIKYNDIDVQYILADNFEQLKMYDCAEKHLKIAHNMIPNRFIPLYKLALLYNKTSKSDKAIQLAHQIARKKVKINSPEIIYIKQEMKNLISRY